MIIGIYLFIFELNDYDLLRCEKRENKREKEKRMKKKFLQWKLRGKRKEKKEDKRGKKKSSDEFHQFSAGTAIANFKILANGRQKDRRGGIHCAHAHGRTQAPHTTK